VNERGFCCFAAALQQLLGWTDSRSSIRHESCHASYIRQKINH